ncbi:endonuclease domain-containing protein [Lysobacter soli]|uniref:endonuclease domain-containing protein n=1 Tax=Lysobacter soli TaxID=453783 RepID=UPI00209D873B|nr:endonuclease domain-containing protein [Lysobacter soli]UTA54893.1 endonuclease domain-containing protein [Lysobacter soli]
MEPIWRNARRLRRAATDAERLLWYHLKGRQLDGHRFRRQYPIAGYIADFACVEGKLVIELDGGQHLQAQHYDERRTQRMNTNGYHVLRFWNDDVLLRTNLVLEEVLIHLRKRSR